MSRSRKVININLFSQKSVKEAIKALEEEKRMMEVKHKMFLLHLAEKCQEHLQRRYDVYDDDVAVTYLIEDGGNTISLHANGDQVAFIEFGAGFYANDFFGPGSWSIEHAHTFQAWERSGKPIDQYPYNVIPAEAFDSLISWMPDLIKEAADEVFK